MSDEAKTENIVEDTAPAQVKWTCEVPTVTKEKPWTVGHKHTLSCRGESTEQLKAPVKIIIKAPEKPKPAQPPAAEAKKQEDPTKDYALFVLETKNIDNDSGDFVVTSYKAGKYNQIEFKLVGADKKEIIIEPMNWEVTTVLTEQNKKGFGPTAPLELGMPWFYWLSILFIVGAVLSLIAIKIFFFMRWQKQVKEMKSYATAIGPTNQFYKDIRGLHSHYKTEEGTPLSQSLTKEYWLSLEEKFKLYIVRQFEVPAYAVSNSKILSKVKKKHQKSWNAKLNGKLKRILAEFKKGHSAQVLNINDISQMEKLCQEFIEQIKKQTESRRAN